MSDQHLSEHERETILLLANGSTIRDVAEKLGKSSESINLYIRSAKQKLDAKNLDHLVAIAVFNSLI